MTAAKRNALDLVLDKIDMKSGSYVEFEVMTESGPSILLAFDHMTGKSIVESWGDKILSYTFVEGWGDKILSYEFKN